MNATARYHAAPPARRPSRQDAMPDMDYVLSIISVVGTLGLGRVEAAIARMGFQVVGREVGRFPAPHTGAEVAFARFQLRDSTPDKPAVNLARAFAWVDALETSQGWDIRLDPSSPRRPLPAASRGHTSSRRGHGPRDADGFCKPRRPT